MGTEALRHEGTKARRHEGTKARRHEGTKQDTLVIPPAQSRDRRSRSPSRVTPRPNRFTTKITKDTKDRTRRVAQSRALSSDPSCSSRPSWCCNPDCSPHKAAIRLTRAAGSIPLLLTPPRPPATIMRSRGRSPGNDSSAATSSACWSSRHDLDSGSVVGLPEPLVLSCKTGETP